MTDTAYRPDTAAAPARLTSGFAVAALILSVVPFVMPHKGVLGLNPATDRFF